MPHENYGTNAPDIVRALVIVGGTLIIAGLMGLWMVHAS